MSSALLSCLGVSGWGPLHWWLPRGGEPEAVLFRLRRAWRLAAAAGAGDPRAALLLASLLRSSSDLIPLAAVAPPPAELSYRHRLVCRPTEPWLHLRSWACDGAAAPWRRSGRERRLDAALLSRPNQGQAHQPLAARIGRQAALLPAGLRP